MNRKPLAIICLLLLVLPVFLSGLPGLPGQPGLPGGPDLPQRPNRAFNGGVQAAASPDYHISRYDVQVVLRPDGAAEVVETISYQVLRSLKAFRYELDYPEPGSIRLMKISAAATATPEAEPVFVDVQAGTAVSNLARPMTYEVKDDGKHLQIQLNVFSDANTRRFVRLTYQLSQGILRHQDAVLLRRRFFAGGEPAVIDQARLAIRLPQVTAPLQIWSLPVSLTNFTATQPSGDELVFQAEKMPAGQDLLLFCLLPADLFPALAAVPQSLSWEELTDAADKLNRELHRQAGLQDTVTAFLMITLTLSVLVGLLIYQIYDREGAANFRQRYLRKMPPDCPPALLAVFLRRTKPGQLILGTLLDLVRRGELIMQGCVFSQNHAARKDFRGFAAFEIFLLQWFFGRITQGTTLSTAEIRRYARNPATASDFQAHCRQFRHLLDEDLASRSLIDENLTRRGRLASQMVALLYLVLAVIGSLTLQTASGLLLLIPSAGLAIYSMRICRLTVAGRELNAQCRALQRTIRDLADFQDHQEDHLTENLLPLSVCLGSAGRFMQRLMKGDNNQLQQIAGQLTIYGLISPVLSGPEQVKALATDMQAMESMLSASLLLAPDQL